MLLAILDPYSCFLPGTSSLATEGRRIRELCKLFAVNGCAVVFLHHAVKSLPYDDELTLEDLNGASIAEHANGWLLLKRTATYRGEGLHELVAVGGSRSE